MGNCVGWYRRRKIRRHIVLILIGLDNAGKTKTVNNLVGEKDDKVLPTVGFKAVNLVHKDTPVTIFDLGGGPQFRQIWPQYYSEVHGVIFVIDSSDFSRLDECREVLEEVLSHDKISGKPILVLANKQDKQGALDDIDVVEKLNIEPLVNKYRCPTLVESYSASVTTKKIDPGLKKGYHWLLNYIVRRYGDINLRVQTDIHAELERRKRILQKSSNQASQTYICSNDDMATQTGFENPKYESLSRKSTPDKLESGVIIVKPITHANNTLDTTVTLECESDNTSGDAKPKLSPLFGQPSGSECESAKIELEPRGEFRKLSPILRQKVSQMHIDFQCKPQSSPSLVRKYKAPLPPNDTTETASLATPHNDGSNTWARHTMKQLDTTYTDKSGDKFAETKGASSDIVSLPISRTLPADTRPASASDVVRRQLEISSQHKRRLSLRYGQRNKTSPEFLSAFMFASKQRHHDMGDFEQNYLNGDLQL